MVGWVTGRSSGLKNLAPPPIIPKGFLLGDVLNLI